MDPPLAPSASSRPTSARGVPLTLAERVAIYCHQSTAANNAAVLRSVAKPTANEIAEFLQQSSAEGNVVYEDPALVRLLLTDSDYDAVCRETLRLEDAIAWHVKYGSHRKQASTSSLHLLLLSAHVFTDEELRAASDLAASQGMDELLRLFPVSGRDKTANGTTSMAPGFGEVMLQYPTEPSVRDNAVENTLVATDLTSERLEVSLDASNSRGNDLVQRDDSRKSDTTEDIKERANQGDLVTEESSSSSITLESTLTPSCPSAISNQCASGTKIDNEESSVKPQEYVAEAIKIPARPCEDEASTREVDNPEEQERSSPLVDSLAECCQVNVMRECAERTVEATISTAVDQSVQHHLSMQHTNIALDQGEAEGATDSEDGSGDRALPGPEAESIDAIHETVPEPTQMFSPELASGIESIVRSLDADLLDEGSADQDDFSFGEDAMLLGEFPVTTPLDLETHQASILSPNDPVEPNISGHVKTEPPDSSPAHSVSFKVGDAIEARYKGTVHFFPGTIVAFHADEGTFDVSYKDGDAETRVRSDLIRYPAAASPRNLLERSATSDFTSSGRMTRARVEPVFRVGDAVVARYHGLDKYFPGEISVVLGGDRYEVRYADGELESDVRAEFIRPLTAMDNSKDRPKSAATVEKAARQDVDVCGTTVCVEPRSPFDQIGAMGSAKPPSLSQSETTQPQASSVCIMTKASPESPAITDSIDSQRNVGEHRIPVQATPLIMETNAPGPCAGSKPDHHDSKERSHPAQRMQKSESTRDTGNRPPYVVKSLTDVTKSIRPAPSGELPVNKVPDADSITAVTQNPVKRSSRRDDTDIVEESIQRRPLPRTNIRTKSRACMKPRNSVADHAERPMEDGKKTVADESTLVVSFRQKSNHTIQEQRAKDASGDSPAIASARALLDDDAQSEEDIEFPVNIPIELSDDDDDDALNVDQILHATERIRRPTPRVEPVGTARALVDTSQRSAGTKPKVSTKKKKITTHRDQVTTVPVLSASTLRYLSPQPRSTPVTARTQRPKPNAQQTITPRAATASQRGQVASGRGEIEAKSISWKELEEWKNVDAILNRKRRVVHNGQIEGSDVPWGEEFAAIQSLKRFAMQYPDVLRDHIESQLAEVVNSNSAGPAASRPMTTKATSAARDALSLIKDLAFLLRHRLAPFFDSILPVVLPAVFHSQKRYLCDTAYDVLEALVTHCSSRKLVVALLKQALRFPRDDLRLVNLTCLYVEKCLATLSVAAVEELVARCAGAVLDAVAELLTCKSAACQSALQKSLLVLQDTVGEDAMENVLADHLVGNALALVRRHVALAETAARGLNKSPSTSPKKLSQQHAQHGATPAKQAAALAAATSGSGGVSILQRMLAQRQNRVVPAPE